MRFNHSLDNSLFDGIFAPTRSFNPFPRVPSPGSTESARITQLELNAIYQNEWQRHNTCVCVKVGTAEFFTGGIVADPKGCSHTIYRTVPVGCRIPDPFGKRPSHHLYLYRPAIQWLHRHLVPSNVSRHRFIYRVETAASKFN